MSLSYHKYSICTYALGIGGEGRFGEVLQVLECLIVLLCRLRDNKADRATGTRLGSHRGDEEL